MEEARVNKIHGAFFYFRSSPELEGSEARLSYSFAFRAQFVCAAHLAAPRMTASASRLQFLSYFLLCVLAPPFIYFAPVAPALYKVAPRRKKRERLETGVDKRCEKESLTDA